MTETGNPGGWEREIARAFISRYLVSAGQEGKDERNTMRLRSVSIFPGFDGAGPDEKESYLEAAEALERKGILGLKWEKRGEGERLKTLSCLDMGKLFELSGGKDPRVEAEEIRVMLKNRMPEKETGDSADPGEIADPAPFLRHLSGKICSAEVARGVDIRAVEDLVCLLEFLSLPESNVNITTRALSVFLYNDSKRLEYLLGLFSPVLSLAKKQGIPAPDLAFLERSFPDTMISGKLVFEYGENDPFRPGGREASVNDFSRPDAAPAMQPLVNAAGLVLGLPLSSAAKIRAVKTIAATKSPAVLTVENKETFYALGEARRGGASRYDCFLYTGGYPNQAAAAMIRVLAASGFRFYHAGDLDPDGILILQNIRDIAGKDVAPVRMDEAAFDRYLFFARVLTKAALYQLEKIRDDTRAIPGMADLIRRIEKTGRGVEQEIIDYRGF